MIYNTEHETAFMDRVIEFLAFKLIAKPIILMVNVFLAVLMMPGGEASIPFTVNVDVVAVIIIALTALSVFVTFIDEQMHIVSEMLLVFIRLVSFPLAALFAVEAIYGSYSWMPLIAVAAMNVGVTLSRLLVDR